MINRLLPATISQPYPRDSETAKQENNVGHQHRIAAGVEMLHSLAETKHA